MSARAYKQFSAAAKRANEIGQDTILKAGDYWIVQQVHSNTELAVLNRTTNTLGNESWQYDGTVNVGHLTRLGNANWAKERGL